jgi:hypothetical protein
MRITNNLTKLNRIFAASLVAFGLSACSTTNYKSTADFQGKMWRAVVVKQYVDTTSFKPGADYMAATKYVPARDSRMRLARVHFSSGWDSTIAAVVIPDNIEFSQLEKGTLVDVMMETGPDTDYSAQRFSRILSIVCSSSDKDCIASEEKANHVGAVLDEHPSKDTSSKYGVAYSRRLTDEETKKYD